MSFVLSVVMPPVAPAAFGQASITEVVTEKQHAVDVAGDILIRMDVPVMAARQFGIRLGDTDTSTDVLHETSGVVFRIDDAEFPPNVCPCCDRLVKPGDHAMARTDDAYCLGCFTWKRDMIACLPENTAHTEEP